MSLSQKQLIIIGDSGVYGWGDIEGGGWCQRLRNNWQEVKGSPIIYSLGVRGDGLDKVANRWRNEWECRGELRRKLPDALLLSVGLNDTARIGTKTGRLQLSLEAFKKKFKSTLMEMQIETFVMVVGLTAINEEVMPFADCLWYSNDSCAKFEQVIEGTCIELGVPFLPIHKEMISNPDWKDWLIKDGIHLNDKGHIWLYDKVRKWEIIYKWSAINLV